MMHTKQNDLNYGPVTLFYADKPLLRNSPSQSTAMLQMEELDTIKDALKRAQQLLAEGKLFFPSIRENSGKELWSTLELLDAIK